MHDKLVLAAVVHTLFGKLADFHVANLNFLQPVLQPFVNESVRAHYGAVLDERAMAFAWSALSAVAIVGCIVGSMLIAPLAERVGRRDTAMLLNNALLIACSAAAALSQPLGSAELLFVARFFMGVCRGLSCVRIIYITETVPDQWRGEVTLLQLPSAALAMALTPIAAALLATASLWPYVMLMPVPFAVADMCFAYVLPRSAKHLYLTMDRRDEAVESIYFYHGADVIVDDVLAEFESEARLAESYSTLDYATIWRTAHLRLGLLICLVANVNMSGQDIAFHYSLQLVQLYGFDESAAYTLLIALQLVALAVALAACFWWIDNCGRRPLFLGSCVGGCVSLLLACASYELAEAGSTHVSRPLGLVTASIVSVSSGLGATLISMLLVGELTPQATRAKVAALAFTLGNVGAFLQVYFWPPMASAFGGYSFLPYFVPHTLSVIWLYFYLPETKQRPIDEIISELKQRCTNNNDSQPNETSALIS